MKKSKFLYVSLASLTLAPYVSGVGLAANSLTAHAEEKTEATVSSETETVNSTQESSQTEMSTEKSEASSEKATETTEEATTTSTESKSSSKEANQKDAEVKPAWSTAFQDGQMGSWTDVVGGNKRTLQDGALDFIRETSKGNNSVSLLQDSPEQADGEVEAAFKIKNGEGRVGVIVRGVDADHWVFVGFNTGKWLIEVPGAWKDDITGPAIAADTLYILKVRYEGEKITIWLNGEKFYEDTPTLAGGKKIQTQAGHVGVRNWYDTKTISYNYFKNGAVGSIPEIVPEIIQVDPVHVFTEIGEEPSLPTQVNTVYNTGEQKKADVTWEQIPAENLEKEGTFTVKGQVAGTEIQAVATVDVVGEGEQEAGDVIGTKELKAVLDPTFPRVIRYQDGEGNKLFSGQSEKINKVAVNGKNYEATATKEKTNENDTKAVYHVNVEELGLTFDTEFTVEDNQVFHMKLTNIKEGAQLINTISIPNQGLVSVASTEKGAAFAGAKMNTGTNANNGNKNGDTFQNLNHYSTEGTDPYMYAFLSKDKGAASIWTNAYGDQTVDNSDSSRLYKQTAKTDRGYVTSLWSGAWTIRPFGAPANYKTTDTPELKIKFSADLNDDKQVDWQDAAIGFRDIMNNPVGAEKVPELVNQRIPFNFASQATNPFLDTLDETKRIYNLTDGLGQMVLLKGYQNEGHDSAHPDYGPVGKRPGGEADMNALVNKGHDLNAIFGVHINATESYPEAKSFNEELVNVDQDRWDWLDPSYAINQRNDALSGNRGKRLDELKQNVPNLDYIYLDVWGNQGEAGWMSREMAKEVNDRGWILANEFPNAMEYSSIWNHWSAEKAYGGTSTKGFNSNIVRFIRNHQKDTWVISDNPLLGGAEFEAHEGWVGKTDFNSYEEVTFRTNIPTKFLQHYQITNWDTTTAKSGQIYGTIKLGNEKGKVVVTQNEGEERTITLDGHEVLKGDSYLIPWNIEGENKAYHWNENGGTTTWDLPSALQDKNNLHVYQLTDQGRIDLGGATVSGNQVTIEAKAKTPYVIAEGAEVKQVEFGIDTPFKDPGFNGKDTLQNWDVLAGKPQVTRNPNGDYVLEPGNDALEMTQTLKKLEAGDYSFYVNTESHGRKVKARIQVNNKLYVREFENSMVQNYIQADVNHTSTAYPQYMQKLRLDFTVPEDATVKVSLLADKGEETARFDDLRIVSRNTEVQNLKKNLVITQDFEDEQAIGLFPFVKAQAGGVEDPRVHLSELHDPYTQYGWNGNKVSDVLEGKWSLKAHKQGAGMMLQTTPQNVAFEPNVKYTVSFDYQTDGADNFYVGSLDQEFTAGNDENIQKVNWSKDSISSTAADGKTKHFSMDVTGAESGKTTVGIYTNGGAYDLIIDNFKVEREATHDVKQLEKAIAEAKDSMKDQPNIARLRLFAATPKKIYTEESLAVLSQQLQDAEKVAKDTDASQLEIDEATKTLNESIEMLVVEGTENDTSELTKLIDQAKDVTPSEGHIFTAESLEKLQKALEKAQAVLGNEAATQEEINQATTDLAAAIDGLEETAITTDVDTKDLQAALKKAKESKPQTGYQYTAATQKALSAAIAKAEKVLADSQATQAAVDEATTALEKAVAELKEEKIKDSSEESTSSTDDSTGTTDSSSNSTDDSTSGTKDSTEATSDSQKNGAGSNGSNNQSNHQNQQNSTNVTVKQEQKGLLPHTGENRSISALIAGIGLALLGIAGLIFYRKKSTK